MSKVLAVCISEKKGTVKREVPSIHCIKDFGIENDAHAGKWHRQVSLMSLKDMEDFHQSYPTENYGAYAENILIDDERLRFLPIGSLIYINDVILEVTQIGKECHEGCAIQQRTGQCIMPRIGIFTKVIQEGTISPHDEVRIEVSERYDRQKDLISSSIQEKMKKQKIVIVGIGALGQMVSEGLVRCGFYDLTLIDGDKISYSNFNRQVFANRKTIGQSKVEVTKQALFNINACLNIQTRNEYVKEDLKLPDDCILVDCTDHIKSKLFLEKIAEYHHVPLVHGAIDGWYGQVATVFPGDHLLTTIYQNHHDHTSASIMMSAQVVSAMQVRDIVKLVMNKEDELRKQFTLIDMFTNEIKTISIQE